MRQIWVLASANIRRDSGGVGGEHPGKETLNENFDLLQIYLVQICCKKVQTKVK